MTCDKCGRKVAGSGFAGSVAGAFCSDACRSDAEIEVAALLLGAEMDRKEKRK
ncbi:hypothetical protein ACIRPH_31245 [Nocardiopsis sp. NPDC101807]|uniref:hypothetical protein n=1 Tax=Nocardiopsis sp. NPDC101807 TaxID=3364339 RepID=UPI00380A03DF